MHAYGERAGTRLRPRPSLYAAATGSARLRLFLPVSGQVFTHISRPVSVVAELLFLLRAVSGLRRDVGVRRARPGHKTALSCPDAIAVLSGIEMSLSGQWSGRSDGSW